jgi:hypothetical protein
LFGPSSRGIDLSPTSQPLRRFGEVALAIHGGDPAKDAHWAGPIDGRALHLAVQLIPYVEGQVWHVPAAPVRR